MGFSFLGSFLSFRKTSLINYISTSVYTFQYPLSLHTFLLDHSITLGQVSHYIFVSWKHLIFFERSNQVSIIYTLTTIFHIIYYFSYKCILYIFWEFYTNVLFIFILLSQVIPIHLSYHVGYFSFKVMNHFDQGN